MAGLAAGGVLQRSGKNFVILEADSRVGGRAITDNETFDIPFDSGAAWIHSAPINPLMRQAKKTGTETIICESIARGYNADIDAVDAGSHIDNSMEAIDCILKRADKNGVDAPSGSLFQGKTIFDRAAEVIIGELTMGVNFAKMSSRDAARQVPEKDCNLVPSGLGNLVASYADGLPVKLSIAVQKVIRHRDWVIVETNRGQYTARTLLVTVSTGVLQSGVIEFDPPLPQWKQDAIDALPMGLLDKVAIQFDRDIFKDTPATSIVYELSSEHISYFLVNPYQSNTVIALVGGDHAAELENQGEQVAIDEAMGQLRKIYGPVVDEAFVRGRFIAWGQNPLTRGSYSIAKPGFQHMRKQLKKPIGNKIFFAGEACSEAWGGCLPGAFFTGEKAARQIIKLLEKD